jgi:hypothetical protein
MRGFLILLSLLLPALAFAKNEDRVKRLSETTRQQFEATATLRGPALAELARATAPERIEQHTRGLLSASNRTAYVRDHLPAGMEILGTLQAPAVVPVTLPGTAVRVGDHTWPVAPLWPNGAMPALCPTGGLTGPLVWVGAGEWSDLRGQELRGAIALMEFAGGRNWERLAAHGVQAVIVTGQDVMLREPGEGLFANTPVPCPRFYVDQATGAQLRSHAGQSAQLTGGAVWAERPTVSLFAWLPANLSQAPETAVVLVPVDSVSVVPDAPHGAKVAANVAVVLSVLEHLATAPGVVRQKNLLVAFLDGEHLGNLASRTFAEFVAQADGNWATRFTENPVEVVARYRRVAWWMEDLQQPIPAPDARWLGEHWLALRVNEQRVQLAEARAARLQRGAPTDDLEAGIAALTGLARRTLENRRLAWPERIRDYGAEAPDWPQWQARLRAELAQEEQRAARRENNTALIKTVLGRLGPNPTRLAWWFDLGDASASVVIMDGQYRYRGTVLPGNASKFNSRFRDAAAYAAVVAGWPEEWAFLTEDDRTEISFTLRQGPACLPECWQTARLGLLPLCTANDTYDRLDTPADTPDRLNFQNLSTQARTAGLMIRLGLESPVDSLPPQTVSQPKLGRLTGRCVQFNVRSGLDAQEPVAGALVYYPAIRKTETDDGARNSATYRGTRKGLLQISWLNGSFAFPVEELGFHAPAVSKPNVYAYRLDRARGVFDMTVDRGQTGSQKQTPDFKLVANQDVEKKLILTAVAPFVFFPGSDPTDYSAIGQDQLVKVQDAVLRGEPVHYAFDNPGREYSEQESEANILYLPRGRRAQFLLQKAAVFKLLLVGEVTAQTPEGAGLRVGEGELTLPLTPLAIARDMHALALRRQSLYERFGITDQATRAALTRAGEKLAAADQALAARDWQQVNGLAREAWGILVRAYPRILTMGREAVFSAVLLMALLVPAAAFLEKLVLGGKGIMARLGGTTLLFGLGVLFLNFFHPAFRISVSPFIVVIAFTMILMSAIVLILCYQRFEVVVRRARAAGGEVESEEISLVSSLATALALGVSNLKKRKTRTFLTAFTVTALTFSIVTFVSVKGTDALLIRAVTLDPDVDGQPVAARPPNYAGVMIREYFWQPLSPRTAAAVQSEFGTRYRVTTRGQYIEVAGGNSADREGVNQIEIRAGKKSAIVTGLLAFEPQEREFSALHEQVTGGAWFSPADRHAIILPDNIAAQLEITAAKLPTPVRMMNRDWQVIGILNTAEADRYRDLNGKSLAMVDYLRSAFTPSAGSGDVAHETPSYHSSWRRFAIVPLAAAGEVNLRLSSVAVRFPPGADPTEFFRDLALRVNKTVFGTVAGQLSLITTKKQQSVGGVAKILVPIILCVLIVTNTMLGAVEERKGEVGMLGAIGLSPAQISFLLLSESTVFSVLGIVLGTFGGLLFANLVPWVRLEFQPGFLANLSLNFASMTAMGLALGTGGVVLLATLVPAKQAAALAAPSGMERWVLPAPAAEGRIRYALPFTLTRGNAVGMTAFFRRFLLNHAETTSPDFNCREVRVTAGDQLSVLCRMWLQPYDLDVAQEFALHIRPTDTAGVFAVALELHRTSGTAEAWLRTNYGFLDLVRRQFLIWRNLDDARRQRYIAEGAGLLKEITA